jgi:chromosomal replication initiator protein
MQLFFDFPVNPKYSFSNFVVCGGNRNAYEFARKLAGPSPVYEVLYLYGPHGSGKTHLLTALGQALHEGGVDKPAPFLSCSEIDGMFGGEYPPERLSMVADLFRDAPALLIDDIHLLPSELRGEVWDAFNDFHAAGRRIAITGLVPPKELVNVDEHLVSRLLWGLVAGMDVSDDESRRLILRKLAEDLQILLCDESIDWILLHTRRDIPSLVEGVEMVRRCAVAAKRKISLRLVREVLS